MLYTALSPHNPDFPCGCRRESRYPCHDFEFTSGEASGGMRFCCAPRASRAIQCPSSPQPSAQCTRKMGFGFSRTAFFLLPLIIIIPRLCLTVPGGAVVASVSVTARIHASTSPLHAMRYGGRKQLAAVCSLGCCACIYSRGPHGGAFSRACPQTPPDFRVGTRRTLVDCGCGPCLFADATKSCTHQSASAGCCWVPSVKSASFDNCVRDLPTTPLWPPLSKWSQSTAAC
jgi:hypothetical protein